MKFFDMTKKYGIHPLPNSFLGDSQIACLGRGQVSFQYV